MESDPDTSSSCSIASDRGLDQYLDEMFGLPDPPPLGREFYCFACRREGKRGHVANFHGLLQHCQTCRVGSGKAHRKLGEFLRGKDDRSVSTERHDVGLNGQMGRNSNGDFPDGMDSARQELLVQTEKVQEDWNDPKFTMTKEEIAACISETNQNLEKLGERQTVTNQMLKGMEKDAKVLTKDLETLQDRLSSLMMSASVPDSMYNDLGPADLYHQLKQFEVEADEMNQAYETCVAKLTEEYNKAIGEGSSFLGENLVSMITNQVKEMMDLEMAVSKMEEEAHLALHQ